MIASAIAAVLLPAFAGYLAAAALLRNKATFLERAGLAYPLGAGFLTLLLFYLGLMRVPFSIYAVLFPLMTASACLMYFLKKKNIGFFNFSGQALLFLREGRPVKQVLIAVVFGWIILKLASIFFVTTTLPIWSPDSWWNWSTRAFVFFNDRGLYLHPDDFFAKSVGHYGYPPHNPLMQVWLAMAMGNFDRVLVKLWVPVYLVSAALFLYVNARKHTGRLVSGVVVLLFLSSPLIMIHSTEPYSDMVAGVYILFALGAFWRLISGEKGYAIICGLLAAQTFFVKLEAMVFVIILASVFFLWFITQKKYRTSYRLLLNYFAPFLLLLPYLFFKLYYDVPYNQRYTSDLSDSISFHRESLALIWQYLLYSVDDFNFILPTLPALLIFGFMYKLYKYQTGRMLFYAALPLVLYVLFFMTVYIFHDAQAKNFADGSLFFRNFLTYYPALYFIICLFTNEIYSHIKNMPEVHNKVEKI